MSVSYMTHPLIKHKITLIRKETTGTNEFRKIIEEIAMLMGYEALADLPTTDVEVKTPIETTIQPVIDGKKLAVVPILRAGLGMVNGILALTPSAKVGHIGLYRDPETHQPHEYYCKLPDSIGERQIVVVDPMLATGGSAIDAVTMIKQHATFSSMSAALTASSTKTPTSARVSATQATESSAPFKQKKRKGSQRTFPFIFLVRAAPALNSQFSIFHFQFTLICPKTSPTLSRKTKSACES